MSSSFSRRDFLKNSLYVAGAAGIGLPAAIPRAMAQAAPATPAVADVQVIDIGSNTLSIGPAQAALQAIARYAPLGGSYARTEAGQLQEVLSAQLGVPTQRIALYPGSGTPLDLVVTTFTSPERALVTADPTFEQAWRTAPKVGANVIKVMQRRNYSHDVQGMCAADAKAGLIYLCSPNNPTGAIVPREDIEYAAAHKPAGSLLVVDEAYIHFSDHAVSAVDLAATRDDVIVLRTFSKLYGMAGLRLGYAVGSPENLARMNARGNGSGSISMTTLMAGVASLEDPGLVPQRRALCSRLRRETVAWLEKQGYPCTTSESNCFMVDIKRPGKDFQRAMATHGVNIGRTWPGFETWPRISVGSESEMQRFREAFAAVMAGKLGPLPMPEPKRRMASLDGWIDPGHDTGIC